MVGSVFGSSSCDGKYLSVQDHVLCGDVPVELPQEGVGCGALGQVWLLAGSTVLHFHMVSLRLKGVNLVHWVQGGAFDVDGLLLPRLVQIGSFSFLFWVHCRLERVVHLTWPLLVHGVEIDAASVAWIFTRLRCPWLLHKAFSVSVTESWQVGSRDLWRAEHGLSLQSWGNFHLHA